MKLYPNSNLRVSLYFSKWPTAVRDNVIYFIHLSDNPQIHLILYAITILYSIERWDMTTLITFKLLFVIFDK